VITIDPYDPGAITVNLTVQQWYQIHKKHHYLYRINYLNS
jgi:hypothetical protein